MLLLQRITANHLHKRVILRKGTYKKQPFSSEFFLGKKSLVKMNEVFQDDHLAHGGICFAWGLAGCHLDWVPWDWPEQKMRKGATEEIWKNFHQRDMKGVSFPVRRPGKVKRKWRKHKLRKICFMELDEKDTEGHLRTWLRWAHLGGVGEEEREGGDEHTSVSFSFSPGIRQMFGACGQHMSAFPST